MGLAQSSFDRIAIAGFGSTARKTQMCALKAQRQRPLGEEHLVSSRTTPDADENSGPGQFSSLRFGGDMLSKKLKVEVHRKLPKIAVKNRAASVGDPVISTSTGRILTGVRAGTWWRPPAVPASWPSRRCAPGEPHS